MIVESLDQTTVGSLADQACRSSEIGRHVFSFDMQQAQIVLGSQVAHVGRALEQLGGAGPIPGHAAPILVHQPQLEGGDRVTVSGRHLVPAGGTLQVLRHAQPLGIDLADQRLRCGVLQFGPWQGQVERREIIAALEGAIGLVHACTRSQNVLADGQGVIGRRGGRNGDGEFFNAQIVGKAHVLGPQVFDRTLLCQGRQAHAQQCHCGEYAPHRVVSSTATRRPMNSHPAASVSCSVASGSPSTAGISMVCAHHWAMSRCAALARPSSVPKNR